MIESYVTGRDNENTGKMNYMDGHSNRMTVRKFPRFPATEAFSRSL